jgi:hypothetical protein
MWHSSAHIWSFRCYIHEKYRIISTTIHRTEKIIDKCNFMWYVISAATPMGLLLIPSHHLHLPFITPQKFLDFREVLHAAWEHNNHVRFQQMKGHTGSFRTSSLTDSPAWIWDLSNKHGIYVMQFLNRNIYFHYTKFDISVS